MIDELGHLTAVKQAFQLNTSDSYELVSSEVIVLNLLQFESSKHFSHCL